MRAKPPDVFHKYEAWGWAETVQAGLLCPDTLTRVRPSLCCVACNAGPKTGKYTGSTGCAACPESRCSQCQRIARPHVTWYGQKVDSITESRPWQGQFANSPADVGLNDVDLLDCLQILKEIVVEPSRHSQWNLLHGQVDHEVLVHV